MAVYSYKPERVSAPVRAALILMTLAGRRRGRGRAARL